MNRLLILSCSQRKQPDPGLLPAIERYDGPAFRVLRKYGRRENARLPLTLVLSARHGLIKADQPISDYDQAMNRQTAQAMQPCVRAVLGEIVDAAGGFDEAMICAGRTYLEAIGPPAETPFDFPVRMASGSIGGQVAALYDWLHGEAPADIPVALGFNDGLDRSMSPAQHVMFRGTKIRLSTASVLELAQKEAAKDPAGAGSYQAWYVRAGEWRVAPKWLLSVLSGIPVSNFRTSDARRVLHQLGVEVHRV